MLVCNLISTGEQCNTYFLCKEFVKPLVNGVLLLNRGCGVRLLGVCGAYGVRDTGRMLRITCVRIGACTHVVRHVRRRCAVCVHVHAYTYAYA